MVFGSISPYLINFNLLLLRLCTSVVGISLLQNIFIMGLRHPYILILHPLSGDKLVSQSWSFFHVFSPVRCYITLLLSLVLDVFVHRLLAASLRIYKLPTVFQDRPQLTSVADNKFLLYPPWIQGFSLFRIFVCWRKICKIYESSITSWFGLQLKFLSCLIQLCDKEKLSKIQLFIPFFP